MQSTLKVCLGLSLLLACGVCQGKPKEKTYPASCDRVWAAVKAASVPPEYNFSMLDDAQRKGIVTTGNALNRRSLDITLTGSGDSCTVAIGGTFSGLAHNDKGDLFKRIEKAMLKP
jgi:hypothetical protein